MTIQIESEKSIKYENVISLRKKIIESEIKMLVGKFISDLQQTEAKKNGPMITATFGMEEINGEKILDMELLIPVDRKVELPKEYVFKPIFHIVNAIYTRYIGNPYEIQNTYVELAEFIQDNKFQQITVAYNFNINDESAVHGLTPIIDIYIGINPSVL